MSAGGLVFMIVGIVALLIWAGLVVLIIGNRKE